MPTIDTKAAHTAGPWHRNIKPVTKYPVIFAGRNTHVATIETRGIPLEEAEANCDLMKAAPLMLAALAAMVATADAVLGAIDWPEYREARAAIAAAKGE
ncbi:MAG: hypothetical protein A3E78_12235 [Alphaproteobacteria bacterium RIFCSPHIGHO2_12_FULL_63_12]|nr:MAG: hypothetical protein A3E78_12235 [Alphaproteobacteria bacterium RIFCSPHIGHO2_12_FULL_63_12]